MFYRITALKHLKKFTPVTFWGLLATIRFQNSSGRLQPSFVISSNTFNTYNYLIQGKLMISSWKKIQDFL